MTDLQVCCNCIGTVFEIMVTLKKKVVHQAITCFPAGISWWIKIFWDFSVFIITFWSINQLDNESNDHQSKHL